MTGDGLPSAFWQAKDAELRRRVAEGQEYQEIALAIGTTRNAVSGRVHRLSIPRPKRKARSPRPLRTPVQDLQRAFRVAERRRPKATITLDVPEPEARFSGLLELPSRGACKWPSGDGPEFHFCGAPTLAHGSYCVYHAFRASRDRKQEKCT